MTDNDGVLDKIQNNAREAGQRLRDAHDVMLVEGLMDESNYRELEIRLTTALAMVEGVYSEARRLGSRMNKGP